MIKKWLIALGGLVLAGQIFAEEVKLPTSVTVDQIPLQLNGAGIRSKFFLDIYHIGVYATPQTSDATYLIQSRQPRRISMNLLRKVDSETMYNALLEGVRHNASNATLVNFNPYLEEMHTFFKRLIVLKKGDTVLFDLIPGKGIKVSIRDQYLEIASDDFAQAILKIWLGEHPVDKKLKAALLGAAKV